MKPKQGVLKYMAAEQQGSQPIWQKVSASLTAERQAVQDVHGCDAG